MSPLSSFLHSKHTDSYVKKLQKDFLHRAEIFYKEHIKKLGLSLTAMDGHDRSLLN